MALHSLMSLRSTSRMAAYLSLPVAIFPSTSALNNFNCSATAAFRASIAEAQLASEPTARNSKRFPVKAKGEVRLRSVLSISNSGIRAISSFIPCLPASMRSSGSLFSRWSKTCDNWVPRKLEIIAGGASLAPRRWALVALEILAFSNPL